MQVGDLVKFSAHPAHILFGIVLGFDHLAEGVLCRMDGQSLWFRTDQVKVVNANR